ncbi:MAG: efflux RND transporter permease subunit, partial [Acholeplasmataceae bacterium]
MEVDLKDLEKEQKSSIVNQDSDSSSGQSTADQLYLGKIKFKSKLRRGWLNFFVSRPRVIFLLIAFLVAIGLYSYQDLPRESSPEVKIPYAAVIATYPGASPADVEELVTKRLETGISGIKGVKQVSSESSNSVSMITVEFDAKENLEDALRKLRDEVNSLSGRLPAEVSEPIVQEISADDSPIWVFTLSGSYDGFVLRDFAEDIKDELEKVPGIREVLVSGGDERQFSIDYDSSKLSFYNLSPSVANSAVVTRNSAIPVGIFDGERYSYSIRTDAQPNGLEDLRNTPLSHTSEGAIIYLKDVASVQETALKKTSFSRLSQEGSAPQESITFQVVKKTGGNIIQIVDEGEKRLEAKLEALPAGLSYATTLDMSDMIEKDFNQLTGDFLLTIILVFSILFLIVGFKEALVAGLAVPLVFFGTFAVMLFSGISLNFLSLYGLILSLGLLVDDAIVVVSATKQYLKSGKFTPEEAVLLVLNDFKVVLTASTLTTVWAFLPLLLATGMMGEYLKSIPITISTTLILSLIIALIINHPLAAVLERIRFGKGLFSSVFIGLLGVAFLAGLYGGTVGLVVTVLVLALLGAASLWYFKGGRLVLKKNSELMVEESFDDEKIKEKLIKQSSVTETSFFTRLFHGIIHFDKVLPVYEKYLRPIIEKRLLRRRFLAFVTILFFIAVSLPLVGVLKYEFFPKTDLEYITIDIKAPHGLKLSETDKIAQEVENRLLAYPEISNFSTVVGGGGSLSYFSSVGASSQANVTVRLKPLAERSLKSYELADLWSEDFKDITGAELAVSALAA